MNLQTNLKKEVIKKLQQDYNTNEIFKLRETLYRRLKMAMHKKKPVKKWVVE